jgi:putative ABC transport system ATP-binding protein
MAEAVLKLDRLTKTYILGDHKPAAYALKQIQKLHKKYEKAVDKNASDEVKQIEPKLIKAQEAFANEKYEAAFEAATGKRIIFKKEPKGVVVHALNGVDIEIKAGELVAIMGPSGSGKSTLLNMLGLLDSPSSGKIYLNGEDVTGIKGSRLPNVRSKELGFVFQSFNLIPSLTALENVMLPLKYSRVPLGKRKELALEALTQVGLENRKNHTPNELSGGQRQRVAIARSLVNKPAIIFGDELTGELDTKMTKEIMDLIIDLNKSGQTFIIVTHNPEVAKMCKRTITMVDGKVASNK